MDIILDNMIKIIVPLKLQFYEIRLELFTCLCNKFNRKKKQIKKNSQVGYIKLKNIFMLGLKIKYIM